jgi:hypothetical protein
MLPHTDVVLETYMKLQCLNYVFLLKIDSVCVATLIEFSQNLLHEDARYA